MTRELTALAVEKFPIEEVAVRPIRRAAMLAVHSNPAAEPGSGDAGGMTVYVRQIARTLANRGIEVDVFTRRDSVDLPATSSPYPGVRFIQIDAGSTDLPKEQLVEHLPEFTSNLVEHVSREGGRYDIIHSHYWLSGWVASRLSDRWGVPFVHTFHTLGRVKNEALREDDMPEPDVRLAGEAKVIAEADAIVASTPQERSWLIDLYAAHPERIHLIPPGVDHRVFRPGDPAAARAALGITAEHVLLFVGRLQPLKSADTTIHALAHLVEWGRVGLGNTKLLIVGGSSGPAGQREPERLRALARRLGVSEAVEFYPAQPQEELPAFYRAADVCLVPSHSESFGLVALEAQACGVPVVGSAVGGLRAIVHHGQTGFLVEPGASEAFAERAWRILSDSTLARSLGRLAECSSEEFSWERSGSEVHDLYSQTSTQKAGSATVVRAGKKFGSARRKLLR